MACEVGLLDVMLSLCVHSLRTTASTTLAHKAGIV
jgi:hypothetical protein